MQMLPSQTARRGTSRVMALTAALAAVALVAACSSSTDVGARSASDISFTVGAPSTLGASAATTTSGTNPLTLSDVKVTIAQAELKRVETDSCEDHEDDDDHPSTTTGSTGSTSTTSTTPDPCAPLKIGTTTVDLPLDGKLVTVPANSLSPGTFRQLDLKISKVELQGTFNGKAFDDTIPLHVHDNIRFNPPLVVGSSGATSVTVNVPVNTWLVNEDGSTIDPTQLATNHELMEQVRRRISASLRAFEDPHHTGKDEHEGDHG